MLMLRDNTLININVFEASRLNKVAKLVSCLTKGMYPPDAPLPLKEETIHSGQPHESNFGSSFGKRIIEPMVRAYQSEYGLDVVGLIPNGIFGPNDTLSSRTCANVARPNVNFLKAREHSDPVWGDGTPLREYTYSLISLELSSGRSRTILRRKC